MAEIKISVILPAYNSERYLVDSIGSVLKQTYRNFELIIIDDCSQDRSSQIIDGYGRQDPRIKVIRNVRNSGVAFSRNEGIAAAAGDYIAFLDADDVWAEEKLERQVSLINKTGARFICSSYDFIDENGRSVLRPHLVPDAIDHGTILKENMICCSSTCIRAALLKAHKFRPNYAHEDFVLWLELLSLPLQAIGDRAVLTHYRLVNGSRSHNKLRAAGARWGIYRDFLKMSVPKSLYYFEHYAVNGIRKYYVNL